MNHNVNEEKTENPTEHRIKKFRKKGKTKYSRELNSLLILFFGFITLWWYKDSIVSGLIKIMSDSFCFDKKIVLNNDYNLLNFLTYLKEISFIFFPFFVVLLCVVLIPPIFLSGIAMNFQSLHCSFNKLNPLNGIKRIFSIETIIEFIKITIKLVVIMSLSYWYLYTSVSEISVLIYENFTSSLLHGFKILFNCCTVVIFGLVPIALFDVFLQQFKYYKQLKMTHQEVKDEFREKEGNPSIKVRIRQEMKASVRRRMMLDIPKADVVIINPIHYSVALKYDEKNMHAPKVIAKGIGAVALKIQMLAMQNKVSIISAPSLARSLYRYSDIGQYIPGPLYKAVAEVLAWVWKVRKWKKEGGIFPEKPKNILVPSELNFKGDR
jgi:flagellar biosynthetic protein FlhB